MIIIGLTLASCLAVGLIGLALLHLVRYRSLRQQLTIATLLPVVAVAATVLINVQLMFLSPHDSLVILIALLVSLLLAALGAWLVVRRISRASLRVGAGLHQLVSDSASGSLIESSAAMAEVAAPRELAQVLEDLAETRRRLQSPARARAAERSRQSSSASCRTICVRRWLGSGPFGGTGRRRHHRCAAGALPPAGHGSSDEHSGG
jgi:hypothetical protein